MKGHVRGRIGSKFIVALCALICMVSWVSAARAQELSEYDVEAAYLYNFGKFVQWPPAASNSPTFQICILGQDPFGGTLDRLITNDTINGKPLSKKILTHASEATGCGIIYIADSEASNIRRILATLDHRPALLVSGIPGFADDGGTVQFLLENHRVRFEINLDAASNSGLVLSSELLKVAVSVIGKPRNSGAR